MEDRGEACLGMGGGGGLREGQGQELLLLSSDPALLVWEPLVPVPK